jgi:hypothetical protein
MITLLPALKDYLTTELGSTVKIVDIRPEAWIAQNLNSNLLPAVFLWEDSKTWQTGIGTSSADEILRVVVTILYQSIDPDVANFHESRGIFALTETIVSKLVENKSLGGAADGLELPIDSQSFQYTVQSGRRDQVGAGSRGGLYAVGNALSFQYIRHTRLNWSGRENDEVDGESPNFVRL